MAAHFPPRPGPRKKSGATQVDIRPGGGLPCCKPLQKPIARPPGSHTEETTALQVEPPRPSVNVQAVRPGLPDRGAYNRRTPLLEVSRSRLHYQRIMIAGSPGSTIGSTGITTQKVSGVVVKSHQRVLLRGASLKRLSELRAITAWQAARHHIRSCTDADCLPDHDERSVLWWYRHLHLDTRPSPPTRRDRRRAVMALAQAAARRHRDSCRASDCSLHHRESETMWWYRQLINSRTQDSGQSGES